MQWIRSKSARSKTTCIHTSQSDVPTKFANINAIFNCWSAILFDIASAQSTWSHRPPGQVKNMAENKKQMPEKRMWHLCTSRTLDAACICMVCTIFSLFNSFINYCESSLCCGKRFAAWERSRSLRVNAAWLRRMGEESVRLSLRSRWYNQVQTAIASHAMENKFRREYLRLIITCGLMAQYSRSNTNEFKVINGKRKNEKRAREKKNEKIATNFSPEWTCENYLDSLHLHKCWSDKQMLFCFAVVSLFSLHSFIFVASSRAALTAFNNFNEIIFIITYCSATHFFLSLSLDSRRHKIA